MYSSNKQAQIVEVPLLKQGDQILIDARLLHRKLKVKSIFANWIKRRIEEFGFEQGKDFFPNLENRSDGKPGKGRIEYHLTIDMAKELAMLERNEIGRNIRQYFIAKEKQARGLVHLPKRSDVFNGLEVKQINNRVMLPYREVRVRCGYSRKSSSMSHRNRYWMHFVKENNLLYVTQEFAFHLYYQKRLINNREALKAQQAVIPMNFGDSSMLLKGGDYGQL